MNKLLAFGGILAIVGGLALLVMPGPPVPLLDANRQVLAESERAGICAGGTYVKTRGAGDEELMTECMEASSWDDTINHRVVQSAFCNGLIGGGFPIDHEQCIGIMVAQELWPTMTGSLTQSWNRRFPYPGQILSSNIPSTGGESRTGDRETNDREGFGR